MYFLVLAFFTAEMLWGYILMVNNNVFSPLNFLHTRMHQGAWPIFITSSGAVGWHAGKWAGFPLFWRDTTTFGTTSTKLGLFHHHWLVLLNAILLVWLNTDMLVFVHFYMCLQDEGPLCTLANWVLSIFLVVFKRQVVLPDSRMELKLLKQAVVSQMNFCEVEVQILASSVCPDPCLLYSHIN